jgi:hypothetical protein
MIGWRCCPLLCYHEPEECAWDLDALSTLTLRKHTRCLSPLVTKLIGLQTEYGSLDQEKNALSLQEIVSWFLGTRHGNKNMSFISKIQMVEVCGCNSFKKIPYCILGPGAVFLSKIFHLGSSNPPASWLDSKAAFLITVIINTLRFFNNRQLSFRIL